MYIASMYIYTKMNGVSVKSVAICFVIFVAIYVVMYLAQLKNVSQINAYALLAVLELHYSQLNKFNSMMIGLLLIYSLFIYC